MEPLLAVVTDIDIMSTDDIDSSPRTIPVHTGGKIIILPHVSRIGVLLIVFGFFLCDRANATSVVAVGGSADIVVVADGKIIKQWDDASGLHHTMEDTECKIRTLDRTGRYFVSASGLYLNRATAFNLWKISESGICNDASTESCVQKVTERAEGELNKILLQRNLSRSTEDVYLDILIVASRPKVAMYRTTFYGAAGAGAVTKTLDSFPAPGQPRGRFILGERHEIDSFEKLHPSWLRGSHMNEAETLVAIEAAALPLNVGPPISILEIVGIGARWIQRGACQAER